MSSMPEYHPMWNLIISVALGAGSAWGATKITIKTQAEKLKKHDTTLERIEMAISRLVPLATCKEDRRECREARDSMTCELSRKMDRLFSALEIQDVKREAGKDEYNKLFMQIMEKIGSLTK